VHGGWLPVRELRARETAAEGHPVFMDVTRRVVESRRFRLAYLTWGDGPPLVLVSGVLQAADDWVRVGYVDALRDFSVIAMDPLGFGASDKPHEAAVYGFEYRAVDVDAVLDAHGVSSALLWGYSFGAMQVEGLRAVAAGADARGGDRWSRAGPERHRSTQHRDAEHRGIRQRRLGDRVARRGAVLSRRAAASA
jgi:pimeloyl-ACP methyl ester carboxylesterase